MSNPSRRVGRLLAVIQLVRNQDDRFSKVELLIPSSALQAPPDVITYSYASRMVCVTPEKSYDVRSPSHLALLHLPSGEHFADGSSSCPPASHRHRQGNLRGTQGRRTPANQLGSPHRAQRPGSTHVRGDRADSLAYRTTVARQVRSRENTRDPAFGL